MSTLPQGCKPRSYTTSGSNTILVYNGYNDSVTIFRNTLLFNFKIGLREKLGKSFYLETYMGIGFKLRYVKHAGRINEEDEISDTEWVGTRRDESGFTLVPSLPLNVKIGYRF